MKCLAQSSDLYFLPFRRALLSRPERPWTGPRLDIAHLGRNISSVVLNPGLVILPPHRVLLSLHRCN